MNATTLSPDLLAATDALAAVLSAAEPIAAYHRSWENLNNDRTATGLLDELGAAQAGARRRQMNGGPTADEITQLRDLQRRAQANPLIMAYVRAQQDAMAYLPGVNLEISDLLGVDFAALSNVSTC